MRNISAGNDTPYRKLQQHLDRQPVGFPPSRTGADVRLLKHIFTPLEAGIAACLRHEADPLEEILLRAAHLVSSRETLKDHLAAMLKKGGIEIRKDRYGTRYANAPLVVGMYELQLGRLTPEFIKDFKAYTSEKRYGISFLATKQSQMRTVPIHKSITPRIPVADFDRIRQLLETAEPPFVILPCICREKKAIQGEPCSRTDRSETCMAMGSIAHTVIGMGLGREIGRDEAIRIIRENQDDGLVLQPANTRTIEFLCSCCGCCCSMLSLQRDLPVPLDFWTSNFRISLEEEICTGCGKCIKQCQVAALEAVNDGSGGSRKPVLNRDRCIGCGHCVPGCPSGALTLIPARDRTTPPATRDELNRIFLEGRKNPLAPVKVIGKLARGIVKTRDLRLLRN
ncbi:MAG: 4Fe-4S binding protein [Desulfobacterales bacterium]|nr:4Fe-4S binding protein [Desulfobacterales bacterium]